MLVRLCACTARRYDYGMSYPTTDAGTVSARTASRVIILCGVPGAGKTHYAERLRRSGVPFVTVSYYDDPASCDSVAAANTARRLCLRRFVEALRDGDGCILVVDNCNLSMYEMMPYISLADAYSVPCEIVRVWCDPNLAAERNRHGITLNVTKVMHTVLSATMLNMDGYFADTEADKRPLIRSVMQSDTAHMTCLGAPGSVCPTCLGHCVDECSTCNRIGVICDGCDGCRDGCLCALPEEHADMLAHLSRPPVAVRIASIR